MSGPEHLAETATDPAPDPAPEVAPSSPGTGLTITEVARTAGIGRRIVRDKLHAGEFPNAHKDAQGFWRIPEGDIVAADLRSADRAGPAPAATSETAPTESAPTESDEVKLLRIEVLDLRHRVERAEALLEAERRLSEERGRALDAERATVDTLYRQTGRARPAPRVPDQPRGDWQASMRAARDRDLQQRAAREREAREREVRENEGRQLPARSEPAPADNISVEVGASSRESVAITETGGDSPRRHRWRKR